jgi:hypothetical protein
MQLLLCLLVISLPSMAGIINGDFESGAGVGWTETSTNVGTPWCTVETCGTGIGTAGISTAGPHGGSAWLWFGGAPNEVGSASQSIDLSGTGTPSLNFWVWAGDAPDAATDYFRVSVDGSQIFQIDQTNAAAYSAYTLVTLSLAAWADGGSHLLSFQESNGPVGMFNLSVDDVSLSNTTAPEPASALLLGAGALLFAAFRRFRAA